MANIIKKVSKNNYFESIIKKKTIFANNNKFAFQVI